VARNRVYVEIDPATQLPVRILKGLRGWFDLPVERQGEWPKKDATEAVRRQVWIRAGKNCDKCGKPISWQLMHLHERVPRSQGGEVSVENGWALCYDCHILEEHSDRLPIWSKK
jgi:hypothetical protein